MATKASINPLDATTWPAECPKCGEAITKTRQCMGHTKRGHCQRMASHGTTVCSTHGGSLKRTKAVAERRIAEAAAEKAIAKLAFTPRNVAPHDALLEEIARSAGFVDLLQRLVDAEGEDGLTQWGMAGRTQSAYWSMLEAERKHFVATAVACARAGVEERQVRIAEATGAVIADVVRKIVTGLGRDLNDPEVREVVEPALRLVRPAA